MSQPPPSARFQACSVAVVLLAECATTVMTRLAFWAENCGNGKAWPCVAGGVGFGADEDGLGADEECVGLVEAGRDADCDAGCDAAADVLAEDERVAAGTAFDEVLAAADVEPAALEDAPDELTALSPPDSATPEALVRSPRVSTRYAGIVRDAE